MLKLQTTIKLKLRAAKGLVLCGHLEAQDKRPSTAFTDSINQLD